MHEKKVKMREKKNFMFIKKTHHFFPLISFARAKNYRFMTRARPHHPALVRKRSFLYG
jgi:hypothetical protein